MPPVLDRDRVYRAPDVGQSAFDDRQDLRGRLDLDGELERSDDMAGRPWFTPRGGRGLPGLRHRLGSSPGRLWRRRGVDGWSLRRGIDDLVQNDPEQLPAVHRVRQVEGQQPGEVAEAASRDRNVAGP